MGYTEKGLSVVLALAVGSLTYKGLCAALRCAGAGIGLPFLFLASLAGLIALGIFLVAAEDSRNRWPRRLAVSGVALFLIVAFWLLPADRSGRAAVERRAKQSQERALSEAHRQKAEEAWRAGLLSRGDHGPPGVVPPMLRAELVERRAIVSNTTPRPLVVALARVQGDAAAPGGWRACAMHTDGNSKGSMRYYSFSLKPGEHATFVTVESCPEALRDSPIEYRVGRYPNEEGWWSDSAFAAPEGREYSEGK
jgi:hypothetical protein